MRCAEVEYWISLRLDGEPLPPQKMGGLDDHLMNCPACRTFFNEESARSGVLKKALGASSKDPAGVTNGILRAAEYAGIPTSLEGRRGARRFSLLPGWALAAAALVLAMAGLLLLIGSREPKGQMALEPDPFFFSILEERTRKADMVTTEEGKPLRRGTSKQNWTIRYPIKTKNVNEVILELEKVDTRYVQPVGWDYR